MVLNMLFNDFFLSFVINFLRVMCSVFFIRSFWILNHNPLVHSIYVPGYIWKSKNKYYIYWLLVHDLE